MRDFLAFMIILVVSIAIYTTYDACEDTSFKESGVKGVIMCIWEGHPIDKKSEDNP